MIYESCVILNPQLSDAELDALSEKLQGVLTAGGAEIREVARWGRRKLAFTINKSVDGFYVVLFYKLKKAGQTLVNFDRTCRYDDNVLRAMTLTVEEKKKGEPVNVLIPAPGYLADFSMKLRAQGPRRRSEGYDRGPRHAEPPRGPAPVGEAALAAEEEHAAVAAEAAPEEAGEEKE